MSRVECIAGVTPDRTTDETTSHLTNPAKDAGQVIGYSHLTKLSKDNLMAIYKPLMWLMALLLSAFVAGCSGGGSTAGLAPTVTAVAPLPNATAVPINTKIITAVFTKEMDSTTFTTASFTLSCPAVTSVTGTIYYLPWANSNLATLTLPAATNLPANTVCTVTISTAAKDTTGNPLASNFVWSFTTGAALDTTIPTVSLTVPLASAIGVAINAKVGATFSEAMDPSTITTTTFTLKQGATAVSGTVTRSGAVAVFTSASNLAASTTYTATITTGAKNLAGNALASDYVWSFTTGATPDTTAPTVTGTIHANGQTNVATNTKVGATFSEAMDPLTITNANFALKETVSGTAVAGTVSYSGVSALFIPLSNLANSTNYTVTIKGGASGVKDLAGNPLASDFVISWTTGATSDSTAPTVTGTIPLNGATNVAINSAVGATFSEGMDPLTITNLNFTLTTDAGAAVPGSVSYSGVNAVFRPLSNLASSTHYNVTVKGGVGGATDLAGNPMAINFTIGWTTAAVPDTTAPTVTGTINDNGATNVAVNSAVGATFSEGMDPLTITNLNFTLTTDTGAVVPGTLSYSGVNAVFRPLSNLASSTHYNVTVKGGGGGVTDLAGNPMASNYAWSWTTVAAQDSTPPTVTLVHPAALAAGVATNTTVSATFSEAMDPLTISTANFTVAGVSGLVTYDATSRIATFTPSGNLAAGTTYTATITTGVNDLASNNLANPFTWTFSTGAVVPASPAPVNLGLAGNFAILAKAGISTTGTTAIVGDIGVSPIAASAITGFGLIADSTNTFSTSSLVTGKIYAANYAVPTPANMTTAISNMETAFTDAAGRSSPDFTELYAGNISGKTLVPGLYKWGTGVLISGAGVTLSGGPSDVWIFQIAQNLTVSNSAAVTLSGGAQAKNIFWQVSGQATLGTAANFNGNILSQTLISLNTGAVLNGRALAQTAVTLNANAVTKPAP